MPDYENVKIKVFGSRKETASYDMQSEQQIATVIREEVLPTTGVPYRSVNVKIKRKADGMPDHLVAYMLRKDTYTADVVRVDVSEDLQVKNVIQNYDDSGEEEDEDEESEGSYGADEEYAVDFVAATPETGIPSAVAAVNALHTMAKNAGLRSTTLLGAAANRTAYKNYLRSSLKGFVNIGHGFPGGIILDDGTLSANWFDGLTGDPVKPSVVYFNSCQVFNPPLQPAVMKAGARTFVGGIVNLGIGTSEEVCKCFWDRSLKLLKGMGTNLRQCEKEKYPTEGAHGISGDTGLFWLAKWFHNKAVLRTHAKDRSKMAWGIVGASGWLRIKPTTPDGTTNVFATLCEALANNRKVDVYVRNGQIEQSNLR